MPEGEAWSQRTRDLWFYAFLSVATIALALLFSPFAYTLLFAVVTVVVFWPFYEYALVRCGGRKTLASVLTSVFLALVVFVPVGTVIYIFVREVAAFAAEGAAWVQGGGLESSMWEVADQEWLDRYAGYLGITTDETELLASVVELARGGALAALDSARTVLPQVANATFNFSVELLLYVFSVVVLFVEGPALGRVLKNLSPMDDAYEERLFDVFQEFSRNMVVGSLATATVQGVVAGIGYAIAGIESVFFYAILTSLGSFVPVIGTAFVWVPLTLYTGATIGIGWGLFVGLWSMLLTGTVDNLLKPIFLRGNSDIHPLLIFLAVFGGLRWMGLPGVLIGPVIVAFFLALYTIYLEDYLGRPMPEPLARAVQDATARRRRKASQARALQLGGAQATEPPEEAPPDGSEPID